jgi:hypothetical protein
LREHFFPYLQNFNISQAKAGTIKASQRGWQPNRFPVFDGKRKNTILINFFNSIGKLGFCFASIESEIPKAFKLAIPEIYLTDFRLLKRLRFDLLQCGWHN